MSHTAIPAIANPVMTEMIPNTLSPSPFGMTRVQNSGLSSRPCDSSHTAGTAVVTLNADVADDVLTQAVEAKDYKVTGIE